MGKAALRGVVRAVKGKASQAGQSRDVDAFCIGATRRRGIDLETAILDATLDLLAEAGVGALTMEGVAAAAHTGKASVYRRWPSKEDLLVDAMRHAMPPLGDEPNTGSVREDLLVMLRSMSEAINSRSGCAITSFMFDVSVDKALLAQVKAQVMEPRLRMLVEALERGRDRGEVRPDAVDDRTAGVGPALLVNEYLMHGPPVSDAFVVELVDRVLLPLVRV